MPYVVVMTTSSSSLNYLHLLNLLRLTKLNSLIRKVEERIASRLLSSVIMLLEILYNSLYSAHILACIFYAIGNHDSKTHPKV